MQALELQIPGNYWDSMLYDGRLYLVTTDGLIHVVKWDELVNNIVFDDDLRPLAWYVLARGRSLYVNEVRHLLKITSVSNVLRSAVDRMTQKKIVISKSLLNKHTLATVESPGHPHTDLEAYYNQLFVSSHGGVYAAPLDRHGFDDFNRVFEPSALQIAGGYRSLGVATGADGLFQQMLSPGRYELATIEPLQISTKYCQSCSWAYYDLVGTSQDLGYIAAYSSPEDEDAPHALIEVISAAEVFRGAEGYLFGAKDQLVLAGGSSLMFETWNPYRRRKEFGIDLERTRRGEREIRDDRLSDGVIDGAVSAFGSVVELSDSLLILASDGTSQRLAEPVNWRCFPRSERYVNQLHVTYDSHLKILAFTHDYFLPNTLRGPATQRRTRNR